MNARNALVFLFVGVAMRALPGLSPDWFPPTGADGTSASAIWLTWMGRIEIVVGGWYLLKHQARQSFRRLAATAPRPGNGAGVSLARARPDGLAGGL
jgi:hypothetical protein